VAAEIECGQDALCKDSSPCTKVQVTASTPLLRTKSSPCPKNVLILTGPLLGPKERANEVRTGLVAFILVFALVETVSSQQSAFSQETNQVEIKRKPTAKVQPKYPPLARQLKLSGKVKVEATVTPDGRVRETRTIGGSPILVNAALDAIKMWRYEASPKETLEVIELDFKDPNQ
jgi:TonB family protein